MKVVFLVTVLTVLGVDCQESPNYVKLYVTEVHATGLFVLEESGRKGTVVNVVLLARLPSVRTGGQLLSHLENVVHDASTHQMAKSLVSVHRDAAVLVDLCILNATEITLVPKIKNAALTVVDADALDLCLWDNIADEVEVKLQTTSTSRTVTRVINHSVLLGFLCRNKFHM
ncbi:hypothetical protein MAR_032497 [Mya arenaria]|uniref:Uncharacterized protein n=1 Tax=Mya arenaria TaxID=6604 RepID=A0ABY7FB34_MYAAR|nr:hypothetical protein MAR_032497 [Mya arenaria]